MIQPIDPQRPESEPVESTAPPDQSTTPADEEPNDLFRELFLGAANAGPSATANLTPKPAFRPSPSSTGTSKSTASQKPTWEQFTPDRPDTLRDAGLTRGQLSDLLIKQLYLSGSLTGYALAGHARLPFTVIDEALEFLKDEKCVEVASGEMLGRISYRFLLTELGRQRAREAFEQCRY
ncbi:MAG: hypothetical protein KDA75_18670, partial [Planctomycetaceae bacterium]|nr:hypothetical protein [Planctomycetaceae bacterium]